MKFIDSTQILVNAGRGGDGIVSFKRSKGKPKLGPDGGDGGTGGNVVLRGARGMNTLSALRYRAVYQAEAGARGGSQRCRGACGDDLVIQVPLGTVVLDAATGGQLGELLAEGEQLLVAKGGRHGLGNVHWVRSTHQAPEEFRPGKPGEQRELRLELKLLADVGLAGFPNAGKSTLLSRVSAARPKIADYPFTTLVPNLGVVELAGDTWGERSFVMADVPGLIEGASAGRGLGLQFLKHLERTSVVLYVLDLLDAERPPAAALAALRHELACFSPELASRRAVIALNKADALDPAEAALLQAPLGAATGGDVFLISAATGQGVDAVMQRLQQLVAEGRTGATLH
jgi:GTP-binding protein